MHELFTVMRNELFTIFFGVLPTDMKLVPKCFDNNIMTLSFYLWRGGGGGGGTGKNLKIKIYPTCFERCSLERTH